MKYEVIDNHLDSPGNLITTLRWEDGSTTEFYQDNFAYSPRTWDPVGTLTMWHSRYDFPNELGCDKPELEDLHYNKYKKMSGEEITNLIGLGWVMMYGEYFLDAVDEKNTLVKRALSYVKKNYLWHYVAMHDHSGISFSHTDSYNFGGWDTYIVGCHFVPLSKLKEEFGDLTKSKLIAKGKKALESELRDYDNWSNGRCIMFIHKDQDGNTIDSCSGFIAGDFGVETLLKAVDGYLEV